MSRHLNRFLGSSLIAAGFIAAQPRDALAHTGQPLAPHDLWSAWTLDPLVVVLLLASGTLYSVGVRSLWRSASVGAGIKRWQATAFAAGWLTTAIALVSPLHALGGQLFSAHMTQHELLIAIAAPLLVVGRPLVPFVWAFPVQSRKAMGEWSKSKSVRALYETLSRPAVAFSLHIMTLWLWHLPGPYQATTTSTFLHALQHSCFIFTALLFWWVILGARGGELNRGAAVFYLFGTALATGALGALLAFAPTLWYPAYAATTGPWGLTPLDDQQLGGLIMWIPGSIPYLIAALAIFAGWLRESETRVVRRERLAHLARTAAGLLIAITIIGCDRASGDQRVLLANSDPDRGQIAIRKYGCGSCHMIPGITGAQGMVGPPLGQIATRVYIGGVVTNEPDNMIRWLEDPPAIDPKTAMPNMGVTPRDARDIAAYLYTLR